MCGICGIHSASGAGVSRDQLEAMNQALVHRGPDADGVFADRHTGLAMRRLAIIDLEGGDQPIANEDGSVVVIQNGEIYNYRELREELASRGHVFRSHSDTEVLVHLYEEHGDDFATRLRGMFAVALWDLTRRRLVVARDPFGIKPLYYAELGDRLVFASEMKALLRLPDVPRDLDSQALETYLTFNWIPGPATILSAVRKLPPGSVLVRDEDGTRIRRYARPGVHPGRPMRGEAFEDLATELREVLRDSVRAHLVADVPVGVLLSGGVDSSVVTALAAQEAGTRLKTFSIGFDDAAFDELDRARLVARRYGTDHHELVVHPDAVELLPELVETYDEPFGDSSALPTYLVSRLAASEVKVVLSGEGGDELFGGYNTYTADQVAPLTGAPARLARALVERLPDSRGRRRVSDRLKRFVRGASLPPLERHCAWSEVLSPEMRDAVLRRDPGGARPDPLAAHRLRYAETAGAERLTRFLDLDLGTFLVDDPLVKSDRASMAHSLELRVPMVDRHVADFAFAVSARHKVRGARKKRLLRAAAAPLIPGELLTAPKQGFSIPAAAWLRGELEPFAREALGASSLDRHGVLDARAAGRLLDEHVAGRSDNSRQLWGLLMLSLWLDKTASVPAGVAG